MPLVNANKTEAMYKHKTGENFEHLVEQAQTIATQLQVLPTSELGRA